MASTSPNDEGLPDMSSGSGEPSRSGPGHVDSKEIQGIKADIAALRVAIDMIRTQYEERMAAIREAHDTILQELGDCGEPDEDAEELTDEVKKMEAKMEILQGQAGGLEMALERYTKLVIEEVEAASEGGSSGTKQGEEAQSGE